MEQLSGVEPEFSRSERGDLPVSRVLYVNFELVKNGWGSRIRTCKKFKPFGCQSQSLVAYQLADSPTN